MSEPITWRTIIGPSVADAARPMDSAGRYINTAFENLQNVLQGREQAQLANVQAQKAANTAGFLDMLSKYRTPEELAAAQASGAIDQARAQYGNMIDRTVARDAFDQRLSTTRDQTTKGQEYADKQQQLKDRPIVNEILTTLYKGNGKGATELLDKNPHLLNHADVQKQVADYMNTLDVRGREATRFTWDEANQKWKVNQQEYEQKMRPLHEQKLRQEIAQGGLNLEAGRFALDQSKRTAADAITAQNLKESLRGNAYSEGIATDQNMEDFRTLMKANNIGGPDTAKDAVDKRAYIVQAIDKAMKDGVPVEYIDKNGNKQSTVINDIPVSAIKAAILGSNDNWYSWNGGWASNFEKNLKNALGRVDPQTGTSTVADDLLAFKDIMRKNADLKQTPTSGKSGKR